MRQRFSETSQVMDFLVLLPGTDACDPEFRIACEVHDCVWRGLMNKLGLHWPRIIRSIDLPVAELLIVFQ